MFVATEIVVSINCLVVSNPCSDAVSATDIVWPDTIPEPLTLAPNSKVVDEPVRFVTVIKLFVEVTLHLWDAADDHCALVPVLPLELIFTSAPVTADYIMYGVDQLSDIAEDASSEIGIVINPESVVLLNESLTVTW